MHFFKNIQDLLQQKSQQQLDQYRHSLASVDALPQLALLGFLCGLVTSGLLVLFRWCSEEPLWWWFGKGGADFEQLPPLWRFLLPTIGGVLIGLWLTSRKPEHRSSGPAHLLERMNSFQGHIPFQNMVTQFVGATLSLLSGQSIGREGPAVYLGGSAGSLMSGKLRLPNNSRQTLIGCGVAAAIAAAFNTPLAGVIFAMEVILMEYTIAGFIPVIIAAVTGTTISRLVFGTESTFAVPTLGSFNSLEEIPFIVFAGIVVGICGTIHMRLTTLLSARQNQWSPLSRMTAAGIATGFVAIWIPEVMGLGYDTLGITLQNQIALTWLMAIFIAKILLTSLSIGLGMPAGLIGPSLVMGGTLGGILSLSGVALGYIDSNNGSFYVLICMAGMMAAILNAPLAALIALLELTYNPNIILPGLLLIAISSITNHHFFGNRSLFEGILESQNKFGRPTPVLQYLNRTGVTHLMQHQFIQVPYLLTQPQGQGLLKQEPRWIVIEHEDERYLLDPKALYAFLEQEKFLESECSGHHEIDLMNIPGERHLLYPISRQASLLDALRELDDKGGEALFIPRHSVGIEGPISGVITRTDIENYYRPSAS
ncbi:MAG: chloride channel protein [Cellvibrionaceae bacterium]